MNCETTNSPYDCTIYDRCEGKLHRVVYASSEDGAHEEASICAAENGCRSVVEIVVGIFE